jgi:hypothetical protein
VPSPVDLASAAAQVGLFSGTNCAQSHISSIRRGLRRRLLSPTMRPAAVIVSDARARIRERPPRWRVGLIGSTPPAVGTTRRRCRSRRSRGANRAQSRLARPGHWARLLACRHQLMCRHVAPQIEYDRSRRSIAATQTFSRPRQKLSLTLIDSHSAPQIRYDGFNRSIPDLSRVPASLRPRAENRERGHRGASAQTLPPSAVRP